MLATVSTPTSLIDRFDAKLAAALVLVLVLAACGPGHPLLVKASLVLIVAVLLSLWRQAAELQESLRELASVADRLAGGEYGARVRSGLLEKAEPGEAVNRLAGGVQRAFAELSGDRAQLETILANIIEAVAAVDQQGRIIALNPAMSSLFKVSRQEALGKVFVETFRHVRLKELVEAVIKERRGQMAEVAVFSPEERLFEAHAVPLAQDGQALGALLVLHDITRLRHLERMRREFVANVSHELRTPLASIRGFAETLRLGAIDDVKHRLEFLEGIEKDAERLTALVDDLLDLSAIESGHRQPVKEPLDLPALAREAAASLRPLAERRKVDVRIEAGAGLPPVRADRSQLKQVFTNLLDNAVKYNRDGGSVTVTVSADGGFALVSVSDTGAGIPEADLPRVFERFYRVDKARSREEGGTGLGLSIVRHILEIHGGTIGVESRLGEGSLFRFKLPL